MCTHTTTKLNSVSKMENSFLLNSWRTIRESEMRWCCTLIPRHSCDLSDHTGIVSMSMFWQSGERGIIMNLEQYKEKVFVERPEAKEEYEKMVDHDFVKGLGERVAAGIEDYMKLQEAVKEIGMERLLELVEADREGR